MTATKVTPKKILTAHDRCDSCGAQAYVKVTGVSGELTFCSHHYTKIMGNPKARAAMQEFAYEVVDERESIHVER